MNNPSRNKLMTNEEKAKSLWYHFCTEKSCEGHSNCVSCPKSQAHPQLLEMAEWKDEQFNQQTEKLREFEKWLYNRQSEYKYERMYEELVGLNDVIEKFEELGL